MYAMGIFLGKGWSFLGKGYCLAKKRYFFGEGYLSGRAARFTLFSGKSPIFDIFPDIFPVF
jgi:hypothetical protein